MTLDLVAPPSATLSMHKASSHNMVISQFLNKSFQSKASAMSRSTKRTYSKDNAGLKQRQTGTKSIGLCLQEMSYIAIDIRVILNIGLCIP